MRISILALGKKKNPNQRLEESKKEIKIPNQTSEENKRKYTERSLDQTISEQYRVVTNKQEKKRNHDWKWSSPFDYQPKSYAPTTFLPRTKQKNKKGKRPKHSEPNSPPKELFPRKSPIDP